MINQYNLYNLEPQFKNWLLAGKNNRSHSPLTIKNYLSDLRHFLGWMIFYLKSHQLSVGTIHELSLQLTLSVINNYKSYLVENKIPLKTINRRLSTLRKFCSFCISQGWIKENPAKKVSNINPIKKSRSVYQQNEVDSDILRQFHQDLIKENFDRSTIKSYLDDIREFFSI